MYFIGPSMLLQMVEFHSFLSEYYSIMYVSWLLWCALLLLPYLGYYNEWALGSMLPLELVSSFSLGIYPGVEMLDHMVALLLVFGGTSIPFSIEAAPIYIPTFFSTSSPATVTCGLFDASCSNRCEVFSHCCFDLYFSD